MRKLYFYCDGSFVETSVPAMEVFTPGKQRLHGVFETMRACGGRVEFLDDHLQRMMAGLKALKVRHPHKALGLARIVRRTIQKNPGLGLARVRLMVFDLGGTTHCLCMVMPYEPVGKGYRVTFIRTKRAALAWRAEVKSLDHALFADAYAHARALGYDEALLVNAKGHVFESSRANVFIVKDGVLLTPPLSSGCLDGIIRRQVLKAARGMKVPVAEKDLTPAMVKHASHGFLTNSMAGIVPIHLP